MVERMWAGWRIPSMRQDQASVADGELAQTGTAGVELAPGQTLFEAILSSKLPDHETHVIWRGERAYALLNRYPYSTGHVLIAPFRAVADLEGLDSDERRELWNTVHDAVTAVKAAFSPDGVNIGANLGAGAGPSVPDHVHVHVVPRWLSDTNFMTAVADVRVLPQTLQECWERLLEAWPR